MGCCPLGTRPLPNFSAVMVVIPPRTRSLVSAALRLETSPRLPSVLSNGRTGLIPALTLVMLVMLVTLVTFVTLVTLTTLKWLRKPPYHGKNGSQGPIGSQPIVPNPLPNPNANPEWRPNPKPKKETYAGAYTGR